MTKEISIVVLLEGKTTLIMHMFNFNKLSIKSPLLPCLFIISLIVTSVELDIIVPSFVEMKNYFDTNSSKIQFLVAINFIGFFLGSIISGPLSDKYGRRRILVFGYSVFLLGSLGCVVSETLNWIIISRFIQGIGAATPAVIIFVMISENFSQEKSLSLYGIMNCVLTLFTSVAPIAGGFINNKYGWEGNFTTILILCFIAWLLIIILLPDERNLKHKFSSILHYQNLLKSSTFLKLSIVPSLLYASYMSFTASAPFIYMDYFKLDITSYTLNHAATIASFSILSIFVSNISKRIGELKTLYLSVILVVLGSTSLLMNSFYLFEYSYLYFTFSMCLFCAGFALSYPILFYYSLEVKPESKGGASSLIMSMRALIVGVATNLLCVLFNGKIYITSTIIFFLSILSLILISFILKEVKFKIQ